MPSTIARAGRAAHTSQEAQQQEHVQIDRKGRRRRGAHVQPKGNEEQLAPPEAISEPAEQQGTEHRTGDVHATGKTNIDIAHVQAGAALERAGYRAGKCHFEAVEQPGDAEGEHQQRMKTPPRAADPAAREDRFRRCCRGRARYVLPAS